MISSTLIALALVALLTAALAAASFVVNVEHVTIVYLIPVLVAATRGGVAPAVLAALAGLCAAAFFYPPIDSLRVDDPAHIADLVLFIFVAVITGRLATSVKHAEMRAEADALRDALIGSVSHELRTPLSSILGSASVLAESPEIKGNARLAGLVRVLREEGERLNEDIQNLLDATRISNEGVRPRPQGVDPEDIVSAAVEHKRRLINEHKLSLSIADNLPMLEVDPMLVENALGQFIENAAKYSAVGSEIEIVATVADGAVTIAVRDRGEGLSAEEQQRVWDRFYRSPRHAARISGSGLGLWIARALISACGGRVEAKSPGVGQGATFLLHLPASAARAVGDTDA